MRGQKLQSVIGWIGLSLATFVVMAAGLLPGATSYSEVDGLAAGESSNVTSTDSESAQTRPAECTNHDFAYSHTDVGRTFTWYYNRAGEPAYLHGQGLAAIKQGIADLVNGYNICGNPRARITAVYAGATTNLPQNYDHGICNTGLNDHVNVVGWAGLTNVDLGQGKVTYLGSTCFMHTPGVMSADVVFNNSYSLRFFTGDVPLHCSGATYDLVGAATHETGHIFGLAHVTQPRDSVMTMYPVLNRCTTQYRTLGTGESQALISKFGPQ